MNRFDSGRDAKSTFPARGAQEPPPCVGHQCVEHWFRTLCLDGYLLVIQGHATPQQGRGTGDLLFATDNGGDGLGG
jgi:hypothetical protein